MGLKQLEAANTATTQCTYVAEAGQTKVQRHRQTAA